MRKAHQRWRKASYSAANGSCVEVQWRKSSHSAGDGNCVEAASTTDGNIALRDSKSPDTGILLFTPAEMTGLLNDIKTGAFA